MSELAKTHILFPRELLKQIDRMVGLGLRSKFVIEAAQEKLAKARALEGLERAAGSWTAKNHPDLKTQQGLNKFLKKIRSGTSKRVSKALNG